MSLFFALFARVALGVFRRGCDTTLALLTRFEWHAVALARFRSAGLRSCVVLLFRCDSVTRPRTRVDCSHNQCVGKKLNALYQLYCNRLNAHHQIIENKILKRIIINARLIPIYYAHQYTQRQKTSRSNTSTHYRKSPPNRRCDTYETHCDLGTCAKISHSILSD